MNIDKTKICTLCSKEYHPTGRCQKVCADCKPRFEKEKAHAKHLKNYKQKGLYKWEMPKGKDSPFYKNGINTFAYDAKKVLPNLCNRCDSTKFLCVHHIDRNRKNNSVSNWEILCKSCHQKEHTVRNSTGQYISKSKA